MSVDILEELERVTPSAESAQTVDTQLMVRLTLAPSWARAVDVKWNPGRGGQKFHKRLEPGESMIWPLDKAMAEFGPFGVLEEFVGCTDERRKAKLREFWAEEKRRALDRYDYPRASHRDRTPTGAHRFPDLTVVIMHADGEESKPIRLHEVYKIGEFDPMKDSFGVAESVEDVKARYESELDQTRREMLEHRAKVAELAGIVQGFVAGKESTKAKVPA